jgi:Zn-dependent peptidase ImmA (M78 family)
VSARSSRLLRRYASRILERHGVTHPPVPVERIAKELGVQLRFVPYEGELAGMLARHSGSEPIIGVNSKHPRARQRFTIAHELGHLILHDVEMHIDRDFKVMRRNATSSLAQDPLEIEANRFAAELLMPYDMLLEDVEATGVDMEHLAEAGALAKKYGVSAQAMMHRLANLAFI